MTQAFKLPDLGEGITEGEVLKVLVAEGDTVAEDQPLFEIETDKAAIEVPSPFAGRVLRIHVHEGDQFQAKRFRQPAQGDQAFRQGARLLTLLGQKLRRRNTTSFAALAVSIDSIVPCTRGSAIEQDRDVSR